MTVRRKLFLALAGLIAAMSLVYIFVTLFVVSGVLRYVNIADRSVETAGIEERLLHYYKEQNGSWRGIGEQSAGSLGLSEALTNANAGLLLLSPDREPLLEIGDHNSEAMRRFGIKHPLEHNGRQIGIFYFYEAEAANLAIIQYGVSSSVVFILLAFGVVFLIPSLLAAYWLAKKFTSPLKAIVPAIVRLGKGDYGTQAPVLSKDEYGMVAESFNTMSRQLLRAEEVRRSLVADVAHELRTPLSIVSGQLELLQQNGKPIDPQQLLPLQDELIRLNRLVGDLHQLSLAEARKLTLTLGESSIAELVQRIVDRYRDEADERSLTLAVTDRTDSRKLLLDVHRMTQVLLNLISNAIRYTPDGGRIAVTLEPEGGNVIKVTVADSGAGIAPDHLPHIFNRFYRTDEARDRNSGGMGLGLAIAKEFVIAHNGTIDVESEVGKGTAFIVRLPANNA